MLQPGITLVEVLLAILMLSLFVLPISLLLEQISFNSKGSYLASSRNILLSRIMEEIDPENPNFYTAYNDTSVQTVTDSGTAIGYMRKVATSSSNAFKRRLYVYLCTETSGTTCTPTYKYTQDFLLEELRIDCGAAANTPFVDNSGQMWLPDGYSYNSGNKVPGYSGSWSASNNLGLGNVITNTANDTLYLTAAEVSSTTLGDSFTYNFDVDTGNYLVQLYFTELTSPGPTRLADVTIEGSKVLDDYSPYASLGNTARKAEVKSFDAKVTDGLLTIKVENGGAANPVANKARLMGLVVRRVP